MYSGFRNLVLSVSRKIIPPHRRSALDPIRRSIRRAMRVVSPSRREQYRLDNMIGPVGYWQEMQDYQLKLMQRMGMRPHHKLLDIGCGPLSGGLAFIPYLEAGNYYGIDVRESAIEEARRQVKKASLDHKKPVLTVSSTFGREELDGAGFDYVWMSQTSYHLDSELMRSCVEQISGRLRPGGRFYADFVSNPELAAAGKTWFEFTWHFHTFDDMVGLGKDHGLEVSNLGKIEDFGYPVDWDLKNNYLLEFRLPN